MFFQSVSWWALDSFWCRQKCSPHSCSWDCMRTWSSKVCSLPVFHCLTGCDTVSSFSGKWKKSAWEAWNCYPEATDAFVSLYAVNDAVDQATMTILEHFVIIMYNRTSECTDLDSSRKYLFTKKSRQVVSPTHIKCIHAARQTNHLSSCSLLGSVFAKPAHKTWSWPVGLVQKRWWMEPCVDDTTPSLTNLQWIATLFL